MTTSSQISWVALVDSVEPERYKKKKVYKFSNDVSFDDTDNYVGVSGDSKFPWDFDLDKLA